MWWTGQTLQKYILPNLRNADEHALYKENFATRPGMHSWAPVAAPFGAVRKERVPPGHRMAEEILRMLKVIADIAQRSGNVIIIPVSWALNTNAWDANCLLAINAQYLKKMRTLTNRKPVKALHTARLVTGPKESCTGSTFFWKEEYQHFASNSQL